MAIINAQTMHVPEEQEGAEPFSCLQGCLEDALKCRRGRAVPQERGLFCAVLVQETPTGVSVSEFGFPQPGFPRSPSSGSLWNGVHLAALPVLDLGSQDPPGTLGDAVPQFPCL